MKKQKLNKQQFKKFVLDKCNPNNWKINPAKPPKHISTSSYLTYRDNGILPLNKLESLLNKMGYQIDSIEISEKK